MALSVERSEDGGKGLWLSSISSNAPISAICPLAADNDNEEPNSSSKASPGTSMK
jgi:hypothetical protein